MQPCLCESSQPQVRTITHAYFNRHLLQGCCMNTSVDIQWLSEPYPAVSQTAGRVSEGTAQTSGSGRSSLPSLHPLCAGWPGSAPAAADLLFCQNQSIPVFYELSSLPLEKRLSVAGLAVEGLPTPVGFRITNNEVNNSNNGTEWHWVCAVHSHLFPGISVESDALHVCCANMRKVCF